MPHDHHHHDHDHDHEDFEELEEYQPTTLGGKIGKLIWNIMFGLMYPILVSFAFVVTGIIKLSSLLSNLIVWVVNKIRN